MTAPLPTAATELLSEWLPPDDSPARPLMTLSTIGLDGYPDARSVLLSAWGPSGFALHTDSRSRKAVELAETPRAALTMVWPELKRQLVIQGDVTVDGPGERALAYARRSRYLQLLAWLNDPAYAVSPEPSRVAGWAQFDRAHPQLDAPPTWIGYRVAPVRVTFWHGREDAASRRIEYALVDGSWTESVLPG